MNILKIANDYSFLVSNDMDLKEFLHNSFRKREKGYFHTRLYKQGKWDGYINFFNKENGKFLTGILPEVELVLRKLNKPYEKNDIRACFEFQTKTIDINFLEGIELYDYQVDLTNQILKYKRGIITAPTSAGKTNVMLAIIKALPYKTPTLVVANRTSLVRQNYESLIKNNIDNVGRLYSKYQEPNYITCCTVQSVHKMKKVFPKIKAILVDEIHENMNKTSKTLYRQLKETPIRVGISATPFKFGGKDHVHKYWTKGFFGLIMKTHVTESGILTTNYLQEQGKLSKSICYFHPINEPYLPYETYQDAIKLGMEQSNYFHNAIKNLSLSLKGRTLILVERVAQGEILSSMIKDSLWISGKDDDEKIRKPAFQNLINSKNAIVIATQHIVSAGINLFIHNLINAAGGKAEHSVIQRMGRGLRTADDKETLNYHDFIFNINDYLYDHSMQRVKILGKEGHEIIIKDELKF